MSCSDLLSRSFSKPANDDRKKKIIEKLLQEVWGFASPQAVPGAKAASYFYHYETLLTNRQLLDEQNTNLHDSDTQSSDVIELIQYLKQNSHTSIKDIRDHLNSSPPHWLLNPQNQEVLDRILHFCVSLWLFSRPNLSDSGATLQQAVRKTFSNFNNPPNAWLWLEFSEKTLRERGGFHLSYTSDISEHLTFASRSIIRVFCHASVIEQYEMTDDG